MDEPKPEAPKFSSEPTMTTMDGASVAAAPKLFINKMGAMIYEDSVVLMCGFEGPTMPDGSALTFVQVMLGVTREKFFAIADSMQNTAQILRDMDAKPNG